jgi:hypothetical protein
VLESGHVRLTILETPGHTPEGISVLVYDLDQSDRVPHAVLTGDTLFIGDVGRPDLMASAGISAQELAGMLYDSLHRKILPLPDETLIYPGHGAGSMCGRNLSQDTVSTLAVQRRYNYALQPMSREEFVSGCGPRSCSSRANRRTSVSGGSISMPACTAGWTRRSVNASTTAFARSAMAVRAVRSFSLAPPATAPTSSTRKAATSCRSVSRSVIASTSSRRAPNTASCAAVEFNGFPPYQELFRLRAPLTAGSAAAGNGQLLRCSCSTRTGRSGGVPPSGGVAGQAPAVDSTDHRATLSGPPPIWPLDAGRESSRK